ESRGDDRNDAAKDDGQGEFTRRHEQPHAAPINLVDRPTPPPEESSVNAPRIRVIATQRTDAERLPVSAVDAGERAAQVEKNYSLAPTYDAEVRPTTKLPQYPTAPDINVPPSLLPLKTRPHLPAPNAGPVEPRGKPDILVRTEPGAETEVHVHIGRIE